MRRALALGLVLSLTLLAASVPATHGTLAVRDYDPVDANGRPMGHGLLAVPAGLDPGESPRGLVVILHGYGHLAESHRGHLRHLGEQGFVAVAMDYTGGGMSLRAGATESKFATNDLLATYPTENVYLYAVSMGAGVMALMLPEMPGVFDYAVAAEPMAMIGETWAEASALAPANAYAAQARADIEREMGGTPATRAAEYAARSTTLRAPEFDVKGVVIHHGVNDGLVPHDQGRGLAIALRAAGIPTDFTTVVRDEPGGEGTTITGYASRDLDQGLTGHGTESNDAHTITRMSFAALDAIVNGDLVPENRESIVLRLPLA